jgi:hypothetical protein
MVPDADGRVVGEGDHEDAAVGGAVASSRMNSPAW